MRGILKGGRTISRLCQRSGGFCRRDRVAAWQKRMLQKPGEGRRLLSPGGRGRSCRRAEQPRAYVSPRLGHQQGFESGGSLVQTLCRAGECLRPEQLRHLPGIWMGRESQQAGSHRVVPQSRPPGSRLCSKASAALGANVVETKKSHEA